MIPRPAGRGGAGVAATGIRLEVGLGSCLVALLSMAGTALAQPVSVNTPPAATARTLVLPFDNLKQDASIFWLGEAAAILLTDGLDAGGVVAITRDERREAFERLQVPTTATLTDATAIRIGQLVGAAHVITGSLQLENGTLVVHARSLALEPGRISRDVVERGRLPELFAIFNRAARRFAPSAAPEAANQSHPSLPALENYVKGLLAETPATAITYLGSALAAMPTFDRARLALWDAYAEQGDYARALEAVAPVAADSESFRRARFLAGLSLLNLRRNEEALAAFTALADAQATAASFNNIGVAKIRLALALAPAGPPADDFVKAVELDPSDADYDFNLGYAYWLMHDLPDAIQWLRETVRRNPADGEAHFIIANALDASGSTVEASREHDLARRLSSVYEQWEKRPAADAVPKGLERVKAGVELPHTRQIETTITNSGQRDQRELAQFYLDRGRRLYQQENDSEAVAQLNRAIYLSPYEAEAHLLVGRIHLRNHRVREAIDAFKISLWSLETAPAHAALAAAYLQNKDAELARAEATRALALDPASVEAREILGQINPQ